LITGVTDKSNLRCANAIVDARFSADVGSFGLITGRTLCVLQALQEKHREANWNKPILNPDKPTRRSDGGGSGTPLAVTMQSLV